jgi:DNA replication protein DnaC
MIILDQKIPVTQERLKFAGVPKRFWTVNPGGILSDREREKAVAVLKEVPEMLESGIGRIITGDFRTGKTSLSCMLLREALSYSASGVFIYSFDLAANYAKVCPQTETAWGDRVRDCEFLVLDDLGAEERTAWAVRRLEWAIRTRYENNQATIITTNLSMKDLESQYTPVFMSVLRRACDDKRVKTRNREFGGKS